MRTLYGRIIEATGWTLPQVDALTLADAEDLLEHWRAEPPAGAVLRAVYRIEPQAAISAFDVLPDAQPREVSEEEFRRIASAEQAFAASGGRRNPFL